MLRYIELRNRYYEFLSKYPASKSWSVRHKLQHYVALYEYTNEMVFGDIQKISLYIAADDEVDESNFDALCKEHLGIRPDWNDMF